MMMARWMCNVTMKYGISFDELITDLELIYIIVYVKA